MVEGEIKVGDRLIYKPFNEETVSITVVEIEHEGYRHPKQSIRVDDGLVKFWLNERDVYANVFRACGWTRITPETLPGDDVESVLAIEGGRIHQVVRDFKPNRPWLFLTWRNERYSYWSPIPTELLPLPGSSE